MLSSTVPYVTKWHKPDKQERQQRHSDQQRLVATFAVYNTMCRTAKARLPRPHVPQEPQYPGYAEVECGYWDMPGFAKESEADYVEPMLISDTTDWAAYPPVTDFLLTYGLAYSDSMHAGFVSFYGLTANGLTYDGMHDYTAEPPVAPAPFTPDTSPLVAAAKAKENDLLLRIKSDCLQEPHIVAVPAAVCSATQPVLPMEQHILQPLMLIDGKPETVERQAERLASCSLRRAGEKRTVFYDGRAEQ